MTNIEKIENSKKLHEAMYELWTDSTPRDITVSFMENGVLQSYTYGNLKKLNDNLSDTVKSEMSKVIHVNANTGSDTDDSKPFKTLHNAIKSVSRSTKVDIVLETDVELLGDVLLPIACIINLNGKKLTLGTLKHSDASYFMESNELNSLLVFFDGDILMNQPQTSSGSTYHNPLRSWMSKIHVVFMNVDIYLQKGVLVGQHSAGETSMHLSRGTTIKKAPNYDNARLVNGSDRYLPIQLVGTIALEDNLTWDDIAGTDRAADVTSAVQIYR